LLKSAQRRKNIAFEIFATERHYVDCLETINQVFLEPLQNSQVVPPDILLRIFSNIMEVVDFHRNLLVAIEARVLNWYPYQQIGGLFQAAVGQFMVHYKSYVGNYNDSMRALGKAMEKEEFEVFLHNAKKNPRCNLLELVDLLIMPVQRLPRYQLLLQDLLQHTEASMQDFIPLRSAVEDIKLTTNQINEHKRKADSTARILVVQEKIQSRSKVTLLQPGRVLVREGLLGAVSSTGQERKIYVFVFSDFIFISKEKKKLMKTSTKYSHKFNIPLNFATLENFDAKDFKLLNDSHLHSNISKNSAQSEENCYFKLVDSSNGTTHLWKAATFLEKKGWLLDIQSTIDKIPKANRFVVKKPKL